MSGHEPGRRTRERPEPSGGASRCLDRSSSARAAARRSRGDPRRPRAGHSAQTKDTDADVDALLDEIDEVLESNSEEFVRGFVQKGGQ